MGRTTTPGSRAEGTGRGTISRRALIGGAIASPVIAAGVSGQRVMTRSTTATQLRMIADQQLAPLSSILYTASTNSGIPLSIDFANRDALLDAVAEPKHEYDLVWPLSSYGIDVAPAGRAYGDRTSFASSPVVWGIKRSVADKLGWLKRDDLTFSDLAGTITANDGALRLIMNSPVHDEAAAAAWFAMMSVTAGRADGTMVLADLDTAQVTDPVIAVTSKIGRMAPSADALSDALVARYDQFDVMIASEFDMVLANWKLVGGYEEPMQIYYPADALGALDAPIIEVQSSETSRTRDIQTFMRWTSAGNLSLRQLISDAGWRPKNATGISLDPSVYVGDWGMKETWKATPRPVPPANVQREAMTRYQQQWRKPSVRILAVDRSGSMEDHGSGDVAAAVDAVLLQDQASLRWLDAAAGDAVVAYPFATDVGEPLHIQGNAANDYQWVAEQIPTWKQGGGSALFEMTVRGLWATEDQHPGDRLSAVIIITDGAGNTGSFDAVDSAFHDSPIGSHVPVYIVLTGRVDPDDETPREIAQRSAGAVIDGTGDLRNALREAWSGC